MSFYQQQLSSSELPSKEDEENDNNQHLLPSESNLLPSSDGDDDEDEEDVVMIEVEDEEEEDEEDEDDDEQKIDGNLSEKELIPPSTDSTIPTNGMNSTTVTTTVTTTTPEVDYVLIPSDGTKTSTDDNDKKKIITFDKCEFLRCMKQGSDRLQKTFEQIPQEYKEILRLSGLAVLSLLGLFVSVVLLRFLRRVIFPQETGWFCTYFAGPFCPLFDALCHEQETYLNELVTQIGQVSNEATSGFGNFFKSIFAGFTALKTIFWAVFGGAFDAVLVGYHELVENMEENVAHLVTFIENCIGHVFGFIHLILSSFANAIINFFVSIKNVFVPEEQRGLLW